MIDIAQVRKLHYDVVRRWHTRDVDQPYDGFLGLVCQQASHNFRLWHEEDIARSPDVGDDRIAAVKRQIDKYNQQRNDWIEKIDDWITEDLERLAVAAEEGAGLNTETPGSAIDRMSIMALRIYHMEEQCERTDVDRAHLEKVSLRLATCLEQLDDLSRSLEQLAGDIYAGRRRHKTYRQFKMYNDPTLNPYLYEARKRLVGQG